MWKRILDLVLLGASLVAQAPTPPDPFASGARWRGKTIEDAAIKNIRVVERHGELVVFECDGFAGSAVFRFAGTMRGGTATIDSIRRTQDPKGSRAVAMHAARGTIKVLANGNLSANVEGQMRSGLSVRAWSFTCLSAELEPTRLDGPGNDRFTTGRRWRGRTLEDDAMKSIRIVERCRETVVFEVEGFMAGAVFRLEGKLRGDTVVVDNIRRTKDPKGHGAVAMREPHGTIRILANGQLSMIVSARMRGSSGTRGWSFTCSGAEPR